MVQKMEAKTRKTLQYKRSFFVRMVSDPKIYNPKIVKIKTKDKTLNYFDESPSSPTMHSWISWPLAFLLRAGHGGPVEEVSMRFRNWNTRLTLTPHGNTPCSSRAQSPCHAPTKRIEEKEDAEHDGLK